MGSEWRTMASRPLEHRDLADGFGHTGWRRLVTVDRSAPPISGRARPRSGVWLAWLAFGAVLAVVAAVVGLWFVVHRPVPGAVGYTYWREATINGLAFATVGVMVASRRPEHSIGWLFLGAAMAAVAQVAAGEYAAAFLAASGPSSGVAVAAWASYQLQSAVVERFVRNSTDLVEKYARCRFGGVP
jgi:hypothetical protein